MGCFTEINVNFDLVKDTPEDVVNIMHYLILTNGNETKPSILPKHEFFKCDRWDSIACCFSYYFDGLTNSQMKYDDISKTYRVSIRASLKNYDCEIEKFLDWLLPYIDTNGFIGYERHEDMDNPTLIYIELDDLLRKKEILFKTPITFA